MSDFVRGDCHKCKYETSAECVPRSQKMGYPKCYQSTVTHYDLLIRRSPEELARFITGEDLCELLCGSPPVCDGYWSCEGKMLAWLKAPAEEGDG